MKNLCHVLMGVCVTLSSLSLSAQNGKSPVNEPDLKKPLLFSTLPERIPVSTEYVNSLFGAPAGRNVSLVVSGDRSSIFEGEVISSGSKYENRIQSVLISSTNFPGAKMTITRSIDDLGVSSYRGLIISFQHGDAYALKNEAGNLVLVKKKLNNVMTE